MARLFTLFLLLSFSFPTFAEDPPYCLALRGNGDLAPAHWGALAQVVERLGWPAAMAGGSSAAVNLFLLESIKMNPGVNQSSEENQKLRASLLLKSLQAYLEVVASRPEWQELRALAVFLKQQGGGESEEFISWLKRMVDTEPERLARLVLDNLDKIEKALRVAVELGLVDPKTFQPLFVALKHLEEAKTPDQEQAALRQVPFYSGEIYQAVTVFGKFDAQGDHNLFFRSGLVSFAQLASSFGQIANFYAGREFTSEIRSHLSHFFASCAIVGRGRTWNELRALKPDCDQKIKELMVAYKQAGLPKGPSRAQDSVSSVIPTFATTALLRGSAYQAAKAAFVEYANALDPEFGQRFQVDPRQVRLGYWGRESDLRQIQDHLRRPFRDHQGRVWDFSQDEKSQLFEPLNLTSWHEVLRLSPAEPGLAPLQEFVASGERVYSAGGWSDLHPGIVLKAFGCGRIIYVTRRGGESLFGQGVAKRLLGFPEVPWERLSSDPEHKAENIRRNNNGDPQDLISQWSRLYNLANPQSSFNRTLDLVDAVLCSDWNRFSSQAPGGITELIADSYRAPWALRSVDQGWGREAVRRGWSIVLPRDNAMDPHLGYRPYAGCLPF